MKASLKAAQKHTDKRAEEACGEQSHLYDNSSCIYDVEKVFNAWIRDSDAFSPAMTLEALCYLADRLEPNVTGHITAFDGDRVLKLLDAHATSTLAQTTDDKLPDKVLEHVMQVFCPDYSVWRKLQNHGLFLTSPGTLESGCLARARLQQRSKVRPPRSNPAGRHLQGARGPALNSAPVGNRGPAMFIARSSDGTGAGTLVQVGGQPPAEICAQNLLFQMRALQAGVCPPGGYVGFEHLPASTASNVLPRDYPATPGSSWSCDPSRKAPQPPQW